MKPRRHLPRDSTFESIALSRKRHERYFRVPFVKTLVGFLNHNRRDVGTQHAVIIGERGMGKTTALWALLDAVEKTAALRDEWQPIMIGTEARFDSLAAFWLRCLRDSDARAWARLTDREPKISAETALSEFLASLDRNGRRALILLEDLDRFIRQLSDEFPRRQLRATLIADSRVVLVGTAERISGEMNKYDEAFFDFFRPFPLVALNIETQELVLGLPLEKLPGGKDGLLRLLLAGNPGLLEAFSPWSRSIAMGRTCPPSHCVDDLIFSCRFRYESLLGSLGVKQMRVFEATALAWRPAPVSELASATQMASNICSAQLAELAQRGFVVMWGKGRRHLYSVKDPLLSLFMLSRQHSDGGDRFGQFLAAVDVVGAVNADELGGASLEQLEVRMRELLPRVKGEVSERERGVDERWSRVTLAFTEALLKRPDDTDWMRAAFTAWFSYAAHSSGAAALEQLVKLENLGPLEFVVDAVRLRELGSSNAALVFERKWLAGQLLAACWPPTVDPEKEAEIDRQLERILGPGARDLLKI